MTRYVFRRLGAGVLTLVLFTFVLFWLVEAIVPGDYFTPFRLGMSQQEVDALRAEAGLDDPIAIRWWRWLTGFAHGGLGVTTQGFGVGRALGEVIPATVFIFATGLLLAYLIGQWLGRVTGWRRTLASDLVTLGGIGFSTLFPPFLGFVIVTVAGLRLRLLRARLFEDTRRELWSNGPFTENQVLGAMTWALLAGVIAAGLLAVLVWRLRRKRMAPSVVGLVALAATVGILRWRGMLPWALDVGYDAILPLIAFTLLAFGEFMLIMQTGMVGTLNEDYVQTARAKGLTERTVRDRHAARNASLAVMARLAVSVPYLLTGLVIIEYSVGWEGIGTFLFRAIDSQDIPAVTSTFAVIGVLTLGVRIGLDLVAMLLDPRIARPLRGERV